MISEFLTPILTAAAALGGAASTEFAKTAGKEAFAKLKERLKQDHGVTGVAVLEAGKVLPAYEAALGSELDKSTADTDPDVQRLAGEVLTALQSLPTELRPSVAIRAEELIAKGNMVFEANEGVDVRRAAAEGEMIFKGNTAPKR